MRLHVNEAKKNCYDLQALKIAKIANVLARDVKCVHVWKKSILTRAI